MDLLDEEANLIDEDEDDLFRVGDRLYAQALGITRGGEYDVGSWKVALLPDPEWPTPYGRETPNRQLQLPAYWSGYRPEDVEDMLLERSGATDGFRLARTIE